jgi:hypothetical protein
LSAVSVVVVVVVFVVVVVGEQKAKTIRGEKSRTHRQWIPQSSLVKVYTIK